MRAERSCLWFSADYLLWWFKNSPVPVPLITTTSTPDLLPTAAFNQPGTDVLLGNQTLDTGARHGTRFTGGMWLDSHDQIGLEGSYFIVASHTITRMVNAGGQTDAVILAIPFFDADAGAENTFPLASPSVMTGAASLSLTSRLQGAEMNGVVRVTRHGDWDIKVLAGFRFLELCEILGFTTASTGIQDPGDQSNNGLILNTFDQFKTRNQFYGWQIGAQAEYRLGNLFANATAKVAVGDMDQKVTVDSLTATNFFNAPPGGPFTGVPTQVFSGTGMFGQLTNQGSTIRHEMAIVFEFGVNVGYQLTNNVRAFVGYDFLCLSNVLRPGNQIDRVINVSQTVPNVIAGNPAAPGERPTVTMTGSEFWAQGLNFGLGLSY